MIMPKTVKPSMLASLHNKIARQLQILLFLQDVIGVMLFGVLHSNVRTVAGCCTVKPVGKHFWPELQFHIEFE